MAPSVHQGQFIGPTIRSLSPDAASTGTPDFQLTVNGAGFVPGSTVFWNEGALTTGFVKSNRLLASVPSPLVAQPDVAQVVVVNPNEQVSNEFPFTVVEGLVITTSAFLPPTSVGALYIQPLMAGGGEEPLIWSLANPFAALPAGLTLAPNFGSISGIPQRAGVFQFGIRVGDAQGTNAFKNFELTVSEQLIITSAAARPPGVVGQAYQTGLEATGGNPPYSWSLAGGLLPPGVNLDPLTGAVSGLPTLAGLFRWAAAVTDSVGASTAKEFRIPINGDPGDPPQLRLQPNRLLFSFVEGAPAKTQRLQVMNGGGGNLGFQVRPPPRKGFPPFLTVRPLAGRATAPEPVRIEVTADPSGFSAGTHFAELELSVPEKGNGPPGPMNMTVPVTMAISDKTQSLRLSQRGMTFSGLAGGSGPPPRSFDVLNDGSELMVWNQQTIMLSGENWLLATPENGISDAGESSPVEVRVDPLALAPGSYYGLVGIGANDAANSPQFVTVVLNWQQADGPSRINVAPEGLIFVAGAEKGAPAVQQVQLTNTGLDTVSYTLQVLTLTGGPWLFPPLPEGEVVPGQPLPIFVGVTAEGLEPGTYRGLLRFSFDDETSRTVDVLLVVTAAGGIGTLGGSVTLTAAPKGGGCVRDDVDPVFSVLGGTSPIPAGWPASVLVDVVDNCGAKMQEGSVVMDFNNVNSPSLAMGHAGNGVWTATWNVPNVAQESMAGVTVTASDLGGITGNLTKAISVSPNAVPVPKVFPGGVVHSASFVPDPLAPGTIVAIVGENLSSEPKPADGTVGGALATMFPLPTELGGTQITLGGEALPLLFSREDQVNAILPFEVADRINESLPLLVRRTDAGSVALSEPVFLTEARPGIFTQNASGVGPGIVQDFPGFQLVTAANPVGEGEVIIIYAAGLGEVAPAVVTGAQAPLVPLSFTTGVATVTIGGVPAAVGFSGLSPGFASLYQINAIVPAGVAPGEVDMVVTIAGQTSTVVTLFVE